MTRLESLRKSPLGNALVSTISFAVFGALVGLAWGAFDAEMGPWFVVGVFAFPALCLALGIRELRRVR